MGVSHGGYSDLLMNHFLHPRHAGALAGATGVGEVKGNACGDVTRTYVLVDGDYLRETGFLACGCGPGIACASYLLDRVTGRAVSEALAVQPEHIARALALPRAKRHAAEMAVESLARAVADHRIRDTSRPVGSAFNASVMPDAHDPGSPMQRGR